MRRGVGSDGRGKAQWLGVQEGKSTILVGGGVAFIFQPGGLNRTICAVEIPENMTIKPRTTGFGLKWLGDGVAALVLQGMFVKFSAGGGLGTAILRPGGRKQSSRLVPDNNDTKIKQWMKWLGLKWPGGFVWAAVRTSPFYHVVAMVKVCQVWEVGRSILVKFYLS